MGKLVAAKASPWQAERALTADAFAAEGRKRKFQRLPSLFLPVGGRQQAVISDMLTY